MKCNTKRSSSSMPWLKKCVTWAVLALFVLSCVSLPAAAADPLNPLGLGIVDSFNDVIREMYHDAGSGLRAYWDNTGGAFLDGLLGDASDADMTAAKDDFVTHVGDELGTVKIGRNGYFIPMTTTFGSTSGYQNAVYPAFGSVLVQIPSGGGTESSVVMSGVLDDRVGLTFTGPGYLSIVANVTGSGSREWAQLYSRVGTNTLYWELSGGIVSSNRASVVAGNAISSYLDRSLRLYGSPGSLVSGSLRAAYFFEPYNFTPGGFTQNVGGNVGRIGNTYMDFGYDDGDDTAFISNTRIVDESQNTYYNPVTGDTQTITDWNYDYSSRSYTVTTGGGETYTITYGDDNVTIIEGGDTYNLYYAVPSGDDGGGGDGPGPTEPTEPGGPTEPGDGADDDDDDQSFLSWLLEQLGKLIGGGIGALGTLLKSILGPIFDAVISLLDLLVEKLGGVVERLLSILMVLPTLFGGFLEFLGAGLAFLPPEAMIIFDVIVVGIVISIILLIIRAFK